MSTENQGKPPSDGNPGIGSARLGSFSFRLTPGMSTENQGKPSSDGNPGIGNASAGS